MKSMKWAFPVLAALLMLPHLFSSPADEIPVGPPRVFSGDEPHYLVLIHSVTGDFDFNLSDDYEAARTGGPEAGAFWSGKPIHHHTSWFDERGNRIWWHVRGDPSKWTYERELPQHPAGLALVLFPLLVALRGTTWLEPVAVLCSGLVMVLAAYSFLTIARRFAPNEKWALAATAVAFLGTPAWHYGRSLFTEGYLVACTMVAAALIAARRFPALAGGVIAIGMLMKPPFALIAVPMGVWLLLRKDWRGAAMFAAGPAAGAALVLLLNHVMFGSPFIPPQVWHPGNVFTGAVGLLLSLEHGLLPFAPVVLVAAAGFFAKGEHRRLALTLLSSVLVWFTLIAFWREWHGGYCFGPRLIVPVIPLACIGLASVPTLPLWKRKSVRITAYTLATLSIAINAAGALPYWKYWDLHPIARLFARLF